MHPELNSALRAAQVGYQRGDRQTRYRDRTERDGLGIGKLGNQLGRYV